MRPISFFKVRFPQFAWGVLVYMLFVILWGAVVRASGSGDGCGKHWPICGDNLVPVFARLATVIEYSHRVSTGLMLPLIGGLCFWAFRAFPRRHPARCGALAAMFFTLTEAAFGAILVKFGLVTDEPIPCPRRDDVAAPVQYAAAACRAALTAWWSARNSPVSRFGVKGVLGLALGVGSGRGLVCGGKRRDRGPGRYAVPGQHPCKPRGIRT